MPQNRDLVLPSAARGSWPEVNRGCYWRFALAVPQTTDLVNNVRDSPAASRTIRFQHSRERGHYGSLPGGFRWNQRRALVGRV